MSLSQESCYTGLSPRETLCHQERQSPDQALTSLQWRYQCTKDSHFSHIPWKFDPMRCNALWSKSCKITLLALSLHPCPAFRSRDSYSLTSRWNYLGLLAWLSSCTQLKGRNCMQYCLDTSSQRGWSSVSRLWWVDPAWMPGAHQSRSITPPPQLDRGEKNKIKGSWVEIRTGRSFTNYRHGQNRLDLGKN